MFKPKKKGGKTGANRRAPANDVVTVTQRLKEDVKKFEQRRDFLDKKAKNELAKAKTLNKKNEKSSAILHLKKKKLYDAEIQKLDSSILTIEEQIIGLESGAITLDILDAKSRGKRAHEDLFGKIDIDRIDKLQGEISDQQGDLEEINELLSENLDYDDPELLEELNQMDLDDFEKDLDVLEDELPAVETRGKTVKDDDAALMELLELEDAPTRKPVRKEDARRPIAIDDDDERQLAELEASML